MTGDREARAARILKVLAVVQRSACLAGRQTDVGQVVVRVELDDDLRRTLVGRRREDREAWPLPGMPERGTRPDVRQYRRHISIRTTEGRVAARQRRITGDLLELVGR